VPEHRPRTSAGSGAGSVLDNLAPLTRRSSVFTTSAGRATRTAPSDQPEASVRGVPVIRRGMRGRSVEEPEGSVEHSGERGPAVARHPDDPLDVSVQLAARAVLGVEGVQLGWHGHGLEPTARRRRPRTQRRGWRESSTPNSMIWSACATRRSRWHRLLSRAPGRAAAGMSWR
jgi:hypothetical protein